jgi:hypothetical protein
VVALYTPAGGISWQRNGLTLEDAYGNPFRFEGTVRHARHVHLQSLSVRARHRNRIVRDAVELQKRGIGLTRGHAQRLSGADEAFRNSTTYASHTSSTRRRRRWRPPTTGSAPPSSSASTLPWRCGTAAGSMRLVPRSSPMPAGSCSERCAGSPRPAQGRRSSKRAWAVRSNGPSTPQQRRMVTPAGNKLCRWFRRQSRKTRRISKEGATGKFPSRTACLAWWSG